MEDSGGVILVGGRSSRMGTPKAALLFDGVPLLQHLIRRLAAIFPEIVLVRAARTAGVPSGMAGSQGTHARHWSEGVGVPDAGGEVLPLSDAFRQEFPGIIIVEDTVADQGPVAGLCAGLAAVKQPLAFVSSCDVPFLNPRLAVRMVELASGYDVVVPEWQGRLHPLQAVYRTRVQPLLVEQLAAGRRRPIDLYERVAVRKLTEEEIRAIDPDGRSFLNMNTPEEYARASALWSEARA